MLVSQLSAPALPRVDEHKKLGVSLQEPPRVTRWTCSSFSLGTERGVRGSSYSLKHHSHTFPAMSMTSCFVAPLG